MTSSSFQTLPRSIVLNLISFYCILGGKAIHLLDNVHAIYIFFSAFSWEF